MFVYQDGKRSIGAAADRKVKGQSLFVIRRKEFSIGAKTMRDIGALDVAVLDRSSKTLLWTWTSKVGIVVPMLGRHAKDARGR